MKKLQEEFPEYNFYELEECIKELNWDYEEGGDGSYENITCDCGAKVKTGGWVGTEHAWCPECGKGMQSFKGLLPAGHATAGHIEYDDYDLSDKKIWTPENIWGLE